MQTDNNEGPIPHHPELILADEAQYYLQKGAQWARFLGIFGFVFCGLIVVAAFFAGSISSITSQYSGKVVPQGMGGFLTILYLLLAVFYFFPSLFLYQFGEHIKKGIGFSNAQQVTIGLGKLKSLFKFWGILTIVIISIYIIILIGAIIGVLMFRH